MTAHIEAKKGEIAKTVIMPGDPKRAKFIAETYLENPKLVSDIRSISAYTGTYNGKEVTIMASGMGMASVGIYASELYKFYDVEKIIRIGTAGSLSEKLKVGEILLAEKAYTTSNFAYEFTGIEKNTETSSKKLNEKIKIASEDLGITLKEGTVNTSSIFYGEFNDKSVEENNCIAVEMETFALLFLAKHLGKQATSVLTISNSLVDNTKEMTADEREKKLTNAIEIVLKSL